MAKNVCVAVAVGVIAGIVLTAVLVSVSIKKLEMTDIAIMYDTLAKKLGDKVYSGGLHTGPVGFKFIIAPSTYETVSSEITCLNKDGVEIELSVTYQYKVQSLKFREVLLQFKDMEGLSKVLVFVGESVLHNVCSRFNTTNFQFERKRFTDTVQRDITTEFNEYYSDVAGLQITNYNRPRSFEKAIEAKMTAFEDINVAGKERQANIIGAETQLKVARTQANITVENAKSYRSIRINQANSSAAVITSQFEQEMDVYTELRDPNGLDLTQQGLLSYMAIRTLENSPNPVQLAVNNPAEFAP